MFYDFISLIYYYARVLFGGQLFKLRETAKLKNAYKGYECFVFGLGPSLRKIDFQKVAKIKRERNMKILAFNAYVNIDDIISLAPPDIYVLSDINYFNNTRDKRNMV